MAFSLFTCALNVAAGARLNELADLFASIRRTADTVSDRALSSLEARADRFVQQLAELKRRVGARLRVPHSGSTATSLRPVISRMTRLNPSV